MDSDFQGNDIRICSVNAEIYTQAVDQVHNGGNSEIP